MSLKETREAAGLSQSQLADLSGVNLRMIQHYEQGVKDINKASVVSVLMLAEAMDADVYDLLNERTEDELIPGNRK